MDGAAGRLNIPNHPWWGKTRGSVNFILSFPSTGIYRTIGPITDSQQECTAPLDQSQPLDMNALHHVTNHSPSTGMHRTM
jgi:hypothetical protein